jgi:NADH dehydrogenase
MGSENRIINAIGPETFTYRKLVEKIGDIIGVHRPLVSVSPRLAHAIGVLVGRTVGDVVITREEIDGLMNDLLCVETKPTGTTKLSDWVRQNREKVGRHYASELARRNNRDMAYA